MSRQYDDSVLHLPECCWTMFSFYAEEKEWIRIRGFEEYYISNDGDVLSLKDIWNPIIMKTYRNQHGHHYVDLSNGKGHKKKCLIHRFVAEAFGCNPKNYKIVRHYDDDPDNNHYLNLKYGTQKDNMADSIRNGGMYFVPVYCYEKDRHYNSVKEAAEDIGTDKSAITMCCRGQIHSIKGLHFCYEKDIEEKTKNPEQWFSKIGNNKRVRSIDVETGEVKEFESRRDAAKYFGIPDCGISSVITGRIKSTHGIRFEEMEDCYG